MTMSMTDTMTYMDVIKVIEQFDGLHQGDCGQRWV